jgi:hypothetical protein
VAGLWIHDEQDMPPNAYSCAVQQRNRLLVQNGCTGGATGPTEKWGADFFTGGECLKYTGCPAQYPVIFCTTKGRPHSAENANAITGFNKLIKDLEALDP